MRLIKMFGLAVIAAVTAMALVGASSAMAEHTAICGQDQALCSSPVEHFHYHTSSAVLLNPIMNVTCLALFLGSTEEPLDSPLVIKGNFTYTGCNGGCSATEVSSKAEVKVLKTGAELASVTGEGEVLVNCGLSLLHCVYNGRNLEGHGLGGLTTNAAEKGHVSFSNAPVEKVSGLLCPNNASLDALFESLVKLYMST